MSKRLYSLTLFALLITSVLFVHPAVADPVLVPAMEASATSELSSYYAAPKALDGNRYSYWVSKYKDLGISFELKLERPTLLENLDLEWYSYWRYQPGHFEIRVFAGDEIVGLHLGKFGERYFDLHKVVADRIEVQIPDTAANRLRSYTILREARVLGYTWHNAANPMDVNDDGRVNEVDVTLVTNDLNRNGSRQLPSDHPSGGVFLDANADGSVAPVDVMTLINYINAQPSNWQNQTNPLDVDADGVVAAADLLTLINEMSAEGSRPLPVDKPSYKRFIDVNGDKEFSPSDLLVLINYFN